MQRDRSASAVPSLSPYYANRGIERDKKKRGLMSPPKMPLLLLFFFIF